MRRQKVEWTREIPDRLGNEPDAHLATRMGLGKKTVTRKRHELGISQFRPQTGGPELMKRLGNESDVEIAKSLGISERAVAAKRKVLAIPRFSPAHWTAEELDRLSKDTDDAIARRMGVSRELVNAKRRELGIPKQSAGRWTDELLARLGKEPDQGIAARMVVSHSTVACKRSRAVDRDRLSERSASMKCEWVDPNGCPSLFLRADRCGERSLDAKKCAVIPTSNPPWRSWRLGGENIQVTRKTVKKSSVIPTFNPPWRPWRLGGEIIQVTRAKPNDCRNCLLSLTDFFPPCSKILYTLLPNLRPKKNSFP